MRRPVVESDLTPLIIDKVPPLVRSLVGFLWCKLVGLVGGGFGLIQLCRWSVDGCGLRIFLVQLRLVQGSRFYAVP